MEILVYGLAIFGSVLLAYKIFPAKDLPSKKPVFAFLPKYQFQSESKNYSSEQVSDSLEALKFVPGKQNDGMQRFVHGHMLGDFSIKVAKVHVDVPITSDMSPTIVVSYGTFALFDTGDLWEFCTELRGKLRNHES